MPYLPELRTERLSLRPLIRDDIDTLVGMYGDPEVMRHIRDGSVSDEVSRRASLEESMSKQHPPGLGVWGAVTRDRRDDLLGWVCLVPLPDTDLIEIGWRFRRDAWGRGYATEAARELLRYGFETLGLGEIVAVLKPGNERSVRVVEKLGMKAEGMRRAYNEDLAYFRLMRASCS
ncbi:MAG: GNAT family N-acetyltransferase [Pseudomonadota bacterium]